MSSAGLAAGPRAALASIAVALALGLTPCAARAGTISPGLLLGRPTLIPPSELLKQSALPSPSALVTASTLVINDQSNAYQFTAPGPGTLTVQLEDLLWPDPLDSLDLSLDSARSVLGQLASEGELSLSIARGGSYFVDVSGDAGGALDLGLYSLQVDFYPQGATVPLPGTLLLLLSGLGILGGAYLACMRNESFMYAI
jgi:hypothetical protein